MAEGRSTTAGCGLGCKGPRCGWVPFPAHSFPRRDPLIDAVGRTDNPCERPARYQPCCKPVPKFRRPTEKPECNINCYRQEQIESKIKEYCEQRQKYLDHYCPCPPPEMVIESLDPCNYPIAVDMPRERPPEEVWFLKDQPIRTNIIAGFFNPDDNKTLEQRRKERCDTFYRSCGPCLPQYPCRGVIRTPGQAWTSLAQEQRLCVPSDCEGSEYSTPEYISKQQELREQQQMEKCFREQQRKAEELRNSSYLPLPHPCCGPEKLSQSPYCNDCKCP